MAPMLACSFLPWARWIDGGVGPGDRAVVHRVDLWQLWSNDLDASAVGLARYRWIVNLVVATVVLAAIAALRRSTGFAVLLRSPRPRPPSSGPT